MTNEPQQSEHTTGIDFPSTSLDWFSLIPPCLFHFHLRHSSFVIPTAYCGTLISAKISRPAEVCNALATCTDTVRPMCARPLLTTIIVPSGR